VTRDLRVCFVGDSFVASVGDPEHLGWVGRLCASSRRSGVPVTGYNLGVRGQTSREVRDRWLAECTPRLSPVWDSRLVVSFGVNDTVLRDGRRRVSAEESRENLASVLRGAATAGWPVLAIGPPPTSDRVQNALIAELDVLYDRVCAEEAVPYVSVIEPLSDDATWMREVAAGDGAHPSAGGYAALAELVAPTWREWTAAPYR
jgi:acyl-CoA thioesterase-1